MLTYQISLSLVEETPLDDCVVTASDPRRNECLESWLKASYWGFDIETYASNGSALDPWRGDIRLIQVALPIGLVLILDLGGFIDRQSDADAKASKRFLNVLKRKLADSSKVVGANLKFDLLWMRVKYGFIARNCRDVMLLSQLYWAGLPYRHNLKAIAERFDIELDKTAQTSDFGGNLSNAQLNYACKDALVVLTIFRKLATLIKQDGLIGSALTECYALPGFVEMEYQGMPVDINHLAVVLDAYEKASVEMLKGFSDEFPGINPDSPKQVVAAINERYRLNLQGTAQEHLSPHWDKPPLKALSLWRSLTTYIDYIKGCKAAYFDGSVRGSFRQIAPKGFGRSTCGDKSADQFPNVNLQNPPNPSTMPKELKALKLPNIRSFFRVPEGKALIVSDLSAAHARIAAEASQDKTLVTLYNTEDDPDFHSITASKLARLQGLDWTPEYIAKVRKDKSNPDQQKAETFRQSAKPTFYGRLNGAGFATLIVTAKTDAGIDLTEKEAKQAVKAWDETYTQLRRYQLNLVDRTNKTEVTFIGAKDVYAELRGLSNRRLYLPKRISDFRPNDSPSVKLSDACAYVWTSTEADAMKLAIKGCVDQFEAHPEWGAYLANLAHDELDVVCDEEYAVEVATAVQAQMQGALMVFVKSIPVDSKHCDPKKLICKSWEEK